MCFPSQGELAEASLLQTSLVPRSPRIGCCPGIKIVWDERSLTVDQRFSCIATFLVWIPFNRMRLKFISTANCYQAATFSPEAPEKGTRAGYRQLPRSPQCRARHSTTPARQLQLPRSPARSLSERMRRQPFSAKVSEGSAPPGW